MRVYQFSKLNNHPIGAEYNYSEEQYQKFHAHPELQMTFVKKGEGMLFCGGSNVRYKPNDFFIFGKNLPHEFVGDNAILTESISVYVSEKWLMNLYPTNNYLQHFVVQSKCGIRIPNWDKSELIEEILNKFGLYRVTSFLRLMETLSEIRSSKYFINKSALASVSDRNSSERLNNVLCFIAGNMNAEIRLKDLAIICELTEPSFSRFFKQKIGKTPSDYITELRVEAACDLLQKNKYSVIEIGHRVGFNNSGNFFKQFKKIKGKTPKQFRNQSIEVV